MARIVLLDELPIRLDALGRWTHGDVPLHPRVAALFARNVWPVAGGGYEVVLGPSRASIEVADVAYFVRIAAPTIGPSGGIVGVQLTLSDGVVEPLVPATLMQAADGTAYCRIVRAQLSVPARFLPANYHALALACEEAQDGTIVLPVAGVPYRFGPYRRAAEPA